MREIARQLVLQSGEALQIPLEDDQDAEDGPAGVQMVSWPDTLFISSMTEPGIISQPPHICRRLWER